MNRKEELFQLIHSLDKHEKRFFKLFASIEEGDHTYLKIFDLIDKQKEYDEDAVRKQTGVPNNVFAVQKHFLFNLILNRLAVLHSSKESDLRMLLTKADILFKKGLYSSYEKLVRKAKEKAKHFEMYGVTLEILRMEHANAWRKTDLKEAARIMEEEKEILKLFNNQKEYTHLANEIISILSQSAEDRDKKDSKRLNELMHRPFIREEKNALTFHSQYTLYHTLFTYYFIEGNLNKQYLYAKKANSLYDDHPEKIKHNPQQYLYSLHNLVNTCNDLRKFEEANFYIDKLHINASLMISEREKAWAFFTYHDNLFGYFINTGKFEEGKIAAEKLLKDLQETNVRLDQMHIFLLLFDSAKIYLGAGELKKSLACMNQIRTETDLLNTRSDLHASIQAFYLLLHYEKGNIDFLESLVKSELRTLTEMKLPYKFSSVMLEFFGKKIQNTESKKEIREEFMMLKKQLLALQKDKQEKIPMEAFDYLSWIESKLENKSLSEIIRKKIKE